MDLLAAPFTVVILAATVLVTMAAFSRRALYEQLMFHSYAVVHRSEWWRLFTTSLVHASWPHLLFNAFSLLSFGVFLEGAIGSWRFALLYVLGVVVATFTSLIIHRNDMGYRAVGASGGVCAVIGAATALFPDLGMYLFFIPIAIPAWLFGAAFIVYSIVGSEQQWGNIGHSAHLGGEVFGIGFAIAFFPSVVLEQWWYVAVMLGAGAVAWLYVSKQRGN